MKLLNETDSDLNERFTINAVIEPPQGIPLVDPCANGEKWKFS